MNGDSYIHSFLMTLFFGFSFCFLTHACSEKQHYRTSVRHIEGGGIGYKHGYTTIEGFFAPRPDSVSLMPFFDVRGHVFNDGKIASNIGFGLRTIKAHRIYGTNLYYDYRKAHNKHYNQISFGLETLGKWLDFRANGYFPVSTKKTPYCNAQFKGFSGNNLLLSQKYQFAMIGGDAEIGVHCMDYKKFNVYAAVGPYYFSEKIEPHVWGAKARLACSYKDYIKLELSNSYDKKFHNRFQCQLTFTLPFGKTSKAKQEDRYTVDDRLETLYCRIVQPVEKEEIIVVGTKRKCIPALNPATGQPYNFVFVNNRSNSLGTYESPYPTLALAQENSDINDIIYVFPGDGTTTGMDAGITLKYKQKLWGSGINHTLQTAQGDFVIPAASATAPKITNTDIDTEGNAITLDSFNQLSGLTITGAMANGVFGTDIEAFDIANCTIIASNVYSVDASFRGQPIVTVMNNTVDQNVNGINFSFDGPSTLQVSNNIFSNSSSVSSAPLIITTGSSPFTAMIENNAITDNTCGGINFVLNDTNAAQLIIKNNTITGNGTGSLASFGSQLLINLNNTTMNNASLQLTNNTFSHNSGTSLYCTTGSFNDFQINATNNMLANNGGGGFSFDMGSNNFTLNATNNSIMNGGDHGVTTSGDITLSTATMTIANNTITGNTNSASGIALSHQGTNLNLAVTNNNLSHNDSSGLVLYSSSIIDTVTVTIANNSITNNQNLGSNAASGIDVEQYTHLTGTITNNTLTNNVDPGVYVGSTDTSPSVCLTMSGNNNDTSYTLSSGTGSFNLAPCDVASVNTGTITNVGTVTVVQSCPSAIPCPP